MKYYINFHTGVGNEYASTLAEAMEIADAGACYTQQDISIHDDETGELVAFRRWYGVEYDPEEDDSESPICFGSYGYYADWSEYAS